MIGPAPGARVMVATRPVDFRKGADSLAALVAAEYGGKPYSGVIYVFRAKRANYTTFSIQIASRRNRLPLASVLRGDGAGLALSAGQEAQDDPYRYAPWLFARSAKLDVRSNLVLRYDPGAAGGQY